MVQSSSIPQSETLQNVDDGAIAIVGMACRFSDVSSPTDFWDMIENGRSGHGRIPERCFDADAWYHPSRGRRGGVITKSGFFLDNVSHFDAPFFSITASEAAAMDPMQRLGLEVAYETFENAGIPMQKLANSRTGVYSGVMTADYQEIAEGDLFRLGDHPGSGTAKSVLANRISWFFDLRGPSISLDTACSSALYSLHLACQSIHSGECDQALVTGTNLILHPNLMAQFTAMHMITPDGISHTFDAAANGYGRGEGVAGVIVKPLKHAIRDGDVIRAVIRATGINFDGKTTGMTVPSGDAQAELIRETYEKAGLSMNDTCYFEAHGTGTPLGDPIEMKAIAKTIGDTRKTDNNGPVYVGSVKPNVGHTEGAAGLAGLIKTVLCLEAGIIPAVTKLKTLNPKLHMDEWNLVAPMENVPWPQSGIRRASVNSFGFGGANAHAILDDAMHYLSSHGLKGRHTTQPIPLLLDSSIHLSTGHGSSSSSEGSNSEATPAHSETNDSVSDDAASQNLGEIEKQHHLFILSAKDQGGVSRVAATYAQFLKNEPSKDDCATMQSFSHILSERRAQLDFRSFVVADTLEDLSTSLEAKDLTSVRSSLKDKVIFVFTGQGAQRVGMARELLSDPIFGESIRRSQKVVTGCGGDWDIEQMLTTGTAEDLGKPLYSQPLCTAIQIGLVDMLQAWNVEPAAVVGHSSGEIAAAYASGVLSHEDAMYVAYYRGTLSSVVSSRSGVQGSMLAAGLSESEAAKYIGGRKTVTIACVNSPSSVTLSGESSAIAEVHEALVKDGKFSRQLRTGVAYHSPVMAVVSEDSQRLLAGLDGRLRPMRVPMYSSVTEKRIEGNRLGGAYWMENMLSTVRFAGAMRNLVTGAEGDSEGILDTKYSAIIEIGPSKTLQGPIKQILAGISPRMAEKLPYQSVLVAGNHARRTALEAAGFLWSTGHSVDLARVNRMPKSSELDMSILPRLPMYPWKHDNSFWHENAASRAVRLRKEPRTDLLGMPVDVQNPFEPRWRNLLSITENPWLAHHRVASACLFPAAGYLVMALEATLKLAAEKKPDHQFLKAIELTDVSFETGLALPDDGSATDISITLKPHAIRDTSYDFSIYSDSFDQPVRRLVTGSVSAVYETQEGPDNDGFEKKAQKQEWEYTKTMIRERQILASEPVDVKSFYAQLASIGLEYGPTFQALERINVVTSQTNDNAGIASGILTVPDTKSIMPMEYEYPHLLHPATLDSAFHLAFAALQTQEDIVRPAVPVSIERIVISTDLPSIPGSQFLGTASIRRKGKTSLMTDIVFADSDVTRPQIVIESMGLSDVGEAANNGTGSQATASRAADVVWKEDIAFMQHFNALCGDAQSQLASWFEGFMHKNANKTVLFVGSEAYESLLETLQATFASYSRVGGRSKFYSCTVPSSNSADEVRNTLPEHIKSVSINGPYDAIIWAIENSFEITPHWKIVTRLLGPGGRLMKLDANNQVTEYSKGDGNSDLVASIPASSPPLSLDVLKKSGVTILEHITCESSPSVSSLREALTEILEKAGVTVARKSLDDIPHDNGYSFVISLVEYCESLVYDWTEQDLIRFRDLVTNARYVLWLTAGGLMTPDVKGLKYSLTQGLLRTVRAEYPQLVLPHLDISPENSNINQVATLIIEVLANTLPAVGSELAVETEFAELGGKVFIPRLMCDTAMDAEIELFANNKTTIEARLRDYRQPLRLSVSTGSTHWIPCEPCNSIGPYEVMVETTHVASSTTTETGSSFNVIGRISQVGSCASQYQRGDSILPLDTSMDLGVQTHFVANISDVLKVPNNVSPAEVAFWIKPLVTAHHLLVDEHFNSPSVTDQTLSAVKAMSQFVSEIGDKISRPNLTPPDSAGHSPPRSATPEIQQGQYASAGSVLIDVEDMTLRAALGQIAHWCGLRVFVVVPKGEKTGLDESASWTVIREMTRSCSKAFRNMPNGSSIRLVLSSLHNQANVQHLVDSLAPGGRFVAINASTQRADSLQALVPRFNITFQHHNTNSLDEFNLRNSKTAIVDLLANKTLSLPSFSNPKSASEISLLSQATDNRHRHIFSLDPQSCIPVLVSGPLSLHQSRLDPAGTYIISGGMGALGLEMAGWLCEQGARHILLLSRSGKANDPALAAIDRLSQKGCKCDVVRCDITSTADLENVASQAANNNLRIRGIIQAAMVLADSPFESMTGKQWATATAPKVHGSWNLHTVLGCQNDLDFFILLSSISGVIGNSAQANYSAGNTFEDAIAAHRRQRGLAAVSLNLGLVAMDTGNVGSIDEFVKRFPHLASVMVSKSEVRTALNLAIRGTGLNGAAIPSQVVVGISASINADDGLSSRWPSDPKFIHRLDLRMTSEDAGNQPQKINYEKAIKAAKSSEEARLIIEDALRIHIAGAMSSDAASIDVDKPVTAYGVDSLKATEVRNWFLKEFDSRLSIFDILSPTPISRLAFTILKNSSYKLKEST